ncbi:hypothetical protein EDD76_101251 [Kineothrix alysoides]|uniref:Uncharacterized protein n=1 Tax=Kineothrix alysoides TaxID=1469948 RepID=A0A4R1R6F8_9FIRM|nr:hypothetical protein [Kineothrix alysoides]TCL61154.1 hypothetical protein EDD76_101251 [Kineothrix alysoides]
MDWWQNPSYAVIGIIGAGAFIGLLILIIKLSSNASKKKVETFKQENPNVATIFIVGEQYYDVRLTKVDSEKAMTYTPSIKSSSSLTYILPGEHTLTLVHQHADESYTKTAEYKKNKVSMMKVSLEANKDYTIHYGETPGDYEIAEGKPDKLI